MVALFLLVPLYLFIPQLASDRAQWSPAVPLDAAIALQPAWVLIYGPLYLFLILLPLFVVRNDVHIRRTVYAYLAVWVSAYAVFFAFPTAAPRPADTIAGDGFAVWGLNFLYEADPPFNCFPSLHVAHSFVSALASYRVHRGVGLIALGGALLVGISTLFTKQHYVLDVAAGMLLAGLAGAVFLRGVRRDEVSQDDRRAAPALALAVAAIVVAMMSVYAGLYLLGVN